MAACDPAEAIWVVMTQTDGHAVLDALNDPPDGEPPCRKDVRVVDTTRAVPHRHLRSDGDLSRRMATHPDRRIIIGTTAATTASPSLGGCTPVVARS